MINFLKQLKDAIDTNLKQNAFEDQSEYDSDVMIHQFDT